MKHFRILSTIWFVSILFWACMPKTQETQQQTTEKKDSVVIPEFNPPDWAVNANIYEVNIRQYTKEGTFAAFQEHIERLHDMGVSILWIMPIHPVGEKERKGTLGSYYAVKDYKDVNPEFGTLDDFRAMVNKAHELDMKVIIDWVANHTAWDNPLIEQHPDWYTRDDAGNVVVPPGTDWTDVADLNYDNADLRKYMIDALKYWVQETDIDGYRCDVAGMVPIDFWINARSELETIKPVFMLAEDDKPEIHQAFDMSYGWEFHSIMNAVAKGEKTPGDIATHLNTLQKNFKPKDIIMHFTSNHDENSWNGSAPERLGDGFKTFAVLASTVPGMPLIYSGQEVSLNKRLEFFEKDPINWKKGKNIQDFYKTLLTLKSDNKALWNGIAGGSYKHIHSSADDAVFAFVRQTDSEKIFVVLNLSDAEIEVDFLDNEFKGIYTELFTGEDVSLVEDEKIALTSWEYRIYVK